MSNRKRAAVLISGSGSNLQSLIEVTQHEDAEMDVVVVASNRAEAFGLQRAEAAGIPTLCMPHGDYSDRAGFDAALVESLREFTPDIVLLAGFMRILTPVFIDAFANSILNIHPSLLPKYRGLNTHQRALDAGDKWHGCTVHFATAELDGGPPIIQGRVKIEESDTSESLAARVLQIEHRIYPAAAKLLASGRVTCSDNVAWLDGEPLSAPMILD